MRRENNKKVTNIRKRVRRRPVRKDEIIRKLFSEHPMYNMFLQKWIDVYTLRSALKVVVNDNNYWRGLVEMMKAYEVFNNIQEKLRK